MKSKLSTLAACVAAMILSQAAMAATPTQDPPAAATPAASDNTSGDRPASVDEDRPQPAPRMSPSLKNAGGASGSVVVMVQVGPDGKAKSFHVMMSSGSKQLDDEAVRTAKSWSYKPAIKNGVPADGYVQIPINFR